MYVHTVIIIAHVNRFNIMAVSVTLFIKIIIVQQLYNNAF